MTSTFVDPPAAGHVVAHATVEFNHFSGDFGALECGIQTSLSGFGSLQVRDADHTNSAISYFALTRGFAISGPTTFMVVCRGPQGSNQGPGDFVHAELNVFYSANRY